MLSYRNNLLTQAYKIYDTAVLVCAFAFASVINALLTRDVTSVEQFFAMRIKLRNIVIIFSIFLVWQLLFSVFSLYRSRRFEKSTREFVDILMLTTFTTFFLLGASVFFHVRLINNLFLINFWTSSSLLLILSRMLVHFQLKRAHRHGRNTCQTIIVGTNNRAQTFASLIQQKPELGYHLLGFVDDAWSGSEGMVKDRPDIIAPLNGIQEFLRQTIIDEVIIGLPIKSFYHTITAIVRACEEQGITSRFIMTDLFDVNIAKSQAGTLEGIPVLTLSSAPVEHPSLIVKRVIDTIVSAILLIMLSPVFLAAAILIKLDSKGPIFFIQDRVGYNKRRFKLIKFRSMVHDAEHIQDELEELNEASGPVFKIKDDPRMTRIGKWLRRTSVDELPQLFNVLTGDMSLVGPRPLPVRDYNGFDKDWHRRRFSVRPGITCLWQIKGRSSIAFDKWMRLDLEYIDNWSLWLDLKILVKTIPAVLKGSGAV
jgi:exopolysaccharide biosynthesis polyprenyl glycosylphosphotransferase